MTPALVTPRRPASSRVRSTRPKSAGASRSEKLAITSSEPPQKKRRYIPGGPGGGGRYVDEDGTEIPVGGTGPGGYNYVGPRGRIGRENAAMGLVPQTFPRRDRSTRTRTVLPRSQQPPMRFSSAAQVAAVVQSDGYKPREERAWEEFHPNLNIEGVLRAFTADEIQGIVESRPVTPANAPQSAEGSISGMNGSSTPNGVDGLRTNSEGIPTPAASLNDESPLTLAIPGTPGGGKRRPGRPPKDPIAFYSAKAAALGVTLVAGKSNASTPKPQRTLPPVQNINAKEKLTLPQPSYRKTDTLARFEDKALGLMRYVDKSMANAGYQETDIFQRSEHKLIKTSDANLEEDLELGHKQKGDSDVIVALGSGGVGRVEYDMDEQDDKWLQEFNVERKAMTFEPITREIFEITITKIEKEWHALEKRIPKPNPKPPQTHRPRSSSAAAVNGEPQAGEEQDSKCAICDDGDCENTNAIVFCDGCDLAVHQECYGVPFIPEGQWLCRKCQLIGRGIPTCIFCPNTDGAFKQTNASKWAHLLCAMWIPEVSLGNITFMEPVMDVEKVPKTRWRLTCYLCNQRMGACIQCGNKACYQAFHVTCARRAHLFLKMKNSHGTLAVLDGSAILKAFCDKHCPPEYAKENDVARATREARAYYKRSMRGRLWADSQASALALAATHRHAVTEHQPDESQLTGAKVALTLADGKKKGTQPNKPIWKLPSGAPVIPQVVFETVMNSLKNFKITKRKEYIADACRYWTLKREARRGAALLKRLQLQMETFSSMEITRRNFAGMGHAGRPRLNRRIEFAQTLVSDLERVTRLAEDVMKREKEKLVAVELEEDVVDTIYFPVAKLFTPMVEKALVLDSKKVFTEGLKLLQQRVQSRFYTTTLAFAQDFGNVFHKGILTQPIADAEEPMAPELRRPVVSDIKERKKLAKRIIKSIQPFLQTAIRGEVDVSGKSADSAVRDLDQILEASVQTTGDSVSMSIGDSSSHIEGETMNEDVHMTNGGEPVLGDEDVSEEPAAVDRSDDVEMHDVNGHEELVRPSVEHESTVMGNTQNMATPFPEVGGNMSQANFETASGIKRDESGPTTNVNSDVAVSLAHNPPTPPLSNGDINTDHSNFLAGGGTPWYMKEFHPDGTSISQEQWTGREAISRLSEDLSDMDEEALNGLGAEFTQSNNDTIVPTPAAAKPKKAKPKRNRRR
ncbi:PHD-finger domain-containing protein [Amylocarpus encephaloides]|uniref:PHD-finger domain-containing protein n=1 Tax=Amylocarpus encephaloides TaxID=45428 RepID=A0A9P7YJW4_9HELO|nr:PHD-finger domain-containing protein [Amylocarpus encephaloides]